jgi:hypothetical protein
MTTISNELSTNTSLLDIDSPMVILIWFEIIAACLV